MIDHVRIEAVMKKLKRSFTMRTVFLAVATVALLTLTAIFMSVGAAGEVTPSDLTADAPSAESGTESEAVVDEPSADEPEGSGEEVKVTPSDLKADASVFRIVSPSEMLNLGASVATMTTAKATGSTFYLGITGTDVYIDKGDGAPVSYGYLNGQRVSFQTAGNTIRLYGNITGLGCYNNQLTALDVSGCAALTVLYCYNNQLTSLDVSGCTALTELNCDNNQLTALDVSHNTDLWYLSCYSNQLTSLDVSKNTALTYLDCGCNQLTSLDVSKNTALTYLDCGCNHLTMPTIYGFNADRFTDGFTYAPQTHIIPATVKAGESINLSSEASVDGTATVFTWYDGNGAVVNPATSNGGVFTFGDDAVGKTLVCKMTNTNLPDFNGYNRLTTTVVTIEGASVNSDPVATMTTAKATGSTISLSITGTDVYIDYGDGTPVLYPGDATVLGSEIKLYGNITGLHCESNQLTALDVSGCAALTYLNCYDNQLTALDVSSNSNLTYLMCSDNPMITSLDVSNNAALVYLICQEIRLTRLDVTHNPNLEVLLCDDSPIGSIDLSQNSKLREFQCCACNISSLNLSNNKELEFLCINGNNVSELDLFNNTKLKTLKCNGNELTSLDLSQNLNLTTLVCDVNYMTMPTIYGFNAGNSLTEFQYAPQTHVIPSNVKAGESINLSSEASVDGTATVFTWYDQEGNEVTPATASGGVFTFGDDAVGKTLVCKMTNAKLPDFRDNVEVEYDDTPEDHTLRTTEVTIEAASASSDPVSSEASDPVSSDDGGNGNNDNNRPRTPYYDLTYKQNDEIDGFRAVQYPEGTIVEINGRKFDLHSIFGIRLNIGHIDKSQRKPILDAIKVYNKSFDPDTNNIIFYEMNLEDSNQAHVNIVKGHVLICMNYPENLPKQWNKYVFHLYHQRKDGSIEEIPVNCMANGIWCTPTDFSPYVLCWDEAKIESAGTGESMVIINVMAILFFVSAMSMNLVLYRRRRLMRNL